MPAIKQGRIEPVVPIHIHQDMKKGQLYLRATNHSPSWERYSDMKLVYTNATSPLIAISVVEYTNNV